MNEWQETEIGVFPASWQITRLEEVCLKVSVGFVGTTSPFFTEASDGVPLIRSQNVRPGVLDIHNNLKCVTPEFHQKNKKSSIEAGDLLIVRVGENRGDCCIVPDLKIELNAANVVFARPCEGLSDFLGFFFRCRVGQRLLSSRSTGSAQEVINTKEISKILVPIPPQSEIEKIVKTLKVLDRKIENLRKQNETLEKIAQTLFKHWFVDFEFPFDFAQGKPSTDVKPYKSSGGAMVSSELGELPADWNVVRMEEISDRIAMGPFGSRITTDNFVESGVPVIRGGNLVDGFNEHNFVYLTEEKADDLKSSNAFPEDIVFTHRGTLGQVGFIPTHSKYPRYVVSQSQMLLSLNKELASPRYVYQFFRSKVGLNSILANKNTTGVPSIGRPTTTLKSIQIILPHQNILRQFDSLIKSTNFKQEANNRQIETLVGAREVLLPKLMNGQIRIV